MSPTVMEGFGLEYWLQWQVLVCALILTVPGSFAIVLLRKKSSQQNHPSDLWLPCWRNLHPRWLLFYRAFAFLSMAYLLYLTVVTLGFFSFFFYTQWTFALVMVYFAVATVVSIRGCRIHSRKPFAQSADNDKCLKKDSEDSNYGTTSTANDKRSGGFISLDPHHNPTPYEQLDFLENLLQIIYQSCAGAVMLTDIVFWCLLVPFMLGEHFQMTLLIAFMHSINAVFLILECGLNRMPFSWFGLIYFILWSCSYVIFQWVLHACCITWWPYPFLDLSTPWAPLWYLALALVHVPFYGFYILLMKVKGAAFSRMFPQSFVRDTSLSESEVPEKKRV